MAYNNGFPMSYQPMYLPQQYQMPQYQPQQPQYQQQGQMPTSQPSIIWISSKNEALSYPVAPNNAVTLWSTTEPVVYLKQADATGKPTLKTYDLVERTEIAPNGSSGQDGKRIEYAEKSDLVAVAGAVKGFNEVLDSLKSEVETMKGDLYGVAGRKKTASRKLKDEDEE